MTLALLLETWPSLITQPLPFKTATVWQGLMQQTQIHPASGALPSGNICKSRLRCHKRRCCDIVSTFVNVSTQSAKELCDLCMSSLRCQMQRCSTIVGRFVNVSYHSAKELCNICMSIERCHMQRCRTIGPRLVNISSCSAKNMCNLCISKTRCPKQNRIAYETLLYVSSCSAK